MRYELSFRDESRRTGGAVVPGRLRCLDLPGLEGPPAEDLLAAESRLLFVTHGFNVSLPDGRASLQRMLDDLRDGRPGLALVSLLWPGDHFMGALSYPFEGQDADATADRLAEFIERVLDASVPLSFVSHSLGARVVLRAVNRLGRRNPIDEVCVMAAAVDADGPADPRVYRRGVTQTKRLSVLSSDQDRVLQLAYPIGDFAQAFLFWRDEPGWALGRRGPKAAGRHDVPANVVHEPIPSRRGADHGDYLPRPDATPLNGEQRSALDFVASVVDGGPPDYE